MSFHPAGLSVICSFIYSCFIDWTNTFLPIRPLYRLQLAQPLWFYHSCRYPRFPFNPTFYWPFKSTLSRFQLNTRLHHQHNLQTQCPLQTLKWQVGQNSGSKKGDDIVSVAHEYEIDLECAFHRSLLSLPSLSLSLSPPFPHSRLSYN